MFLHVQAGHIGGKLIELCNADLAQAAPGVGGDGDTDLGESCSEEAESKGAEDDGFHFVDTARANIGIFQEAVPAEKARRGPAWRACSAVGGDGT